MNLLQEIENLMRLDPGGWKSVYAHGNHGKIAELSYQDKILIRFAYEWTASSGGWRKIVVFPLAIELGWLERMRMDRMLRRLVGYKTQSISKEVAQKIVDARNHEVEAAMQDLEKGLAAQFAELEAADRKEKQKQLEAPVVNGFLRGAQKRLRGTRE